MSINSLRSNSGLVQETGQRQMHQASSPALAFARRFLRLGLTLAAIGSAFVAQAANYQPSKVVPPAPTREFRAAWVATVANIDWPSRKALSTQEQKAELLALLDRAAQLKLNAVIFQVRPACDAMYASRI